MNSERKYIAIDLKSFYASVECVERGIDPLLFNLVVADPTRTEKTICLAVSPSLKSYGISGRARLFEVVQKVKEVNAQRLYNAPGHKFRDSSTYAPDINSDPSLELDFIIAPPRMKKYMDVSSQVYDIYLKYIAPEDIHVYSVDEVFMDVTNYLTLYNMTPHELAMTMIHDVLHETGITATAGIGTNMYLCKIAMDIVAKHIPADKDGVRIAELDEMKYRELLWDHRPLTDFWRVGRGISRRLEANGMYTMGDIARCSLGSPSQFYNEDLLYKLFGINAELLIDHAWGWEPCTIKDIKSYRPSSNSVSLGQVLKCPYSFEKGRLIIREMTDLLVLDIVEKGLVTDQMVLTVGYDIENLQNPEIAEKYTGEIDPDFYGRPVPKSAHGSINLSGYVSSTKEIMEAVTTLYESIVNPILTVRRMYVVANHVIPERKAKAMQPAFEQLDLFTDYAELEEKRKKEEESRKKEKSMQKAMIEIKNRYGKNAMLKGMNFEEGGTTIERNGQIGGHRAST